MQHKIAQRQETQPVIGFGDTRFYSEFCRGPMCMGQSWIVTGKEIELGDFTQSALKYQPKRAEMNRPSRMARTWGDHLSSTRSSVTINQDTEEGPDQHDCQARRKLCFIPEKALRRMLLKLLGCRQHLFLLRFPLLL